MSVTSTTEQTGPSTISSFPQTIAVGFPFQQGSDLLVLDIGPASGLYEPAKTLVLGSDYTTSGGGYNTAQDMQTGSITVGTGGTNNVQVNDQIIIARAVTLNQTTSLMPNLYALSGPTEAALDKTATIDQQLAANIARCLQLENYETLPTTLLIEARKGMLLGFDANGNIAFYANQNPITPPSGNFPAGIIVGTAITLTNGGTITPTAGHATVSAPWIFAAGATIPVSQTLTLPSGGTITDDGAGNTVITGPTQIVGAVAINGAVTMGSTLAINALLTPGSGVHGMAGTGSAAAGNIGEYIKAEAFETTAVLTNNVAVNVFGTATAAITVTSGDWDVGGSVYFFANAATCTQVVGTVSTTTASLNPTYATVATPVALSGGLFHIKQTIPTQRISVSTNTALYLNGFASFSAGAVSAGGYVWARRSASAGV